MSDYPSYSVAIRTLGRAGEKYRQLILSLKSQTLPAEGIYVYIAQGYPFPAAVADERYIPCPKGMVAQRALPYLEIQSQYILFCDDDVFFPPDAVRVLFDALKAGKGDGISPNVFPNHTMPFPEKLKAAVFSGTLPALSKRFAFQVRMNACYSYCAKPSDVMPTQSFAGPCSLISREAFLSIHLEDEIWMDRSRYPLGEDQVLSYKLYVSGYRILVHFNSGIVHCDARTGRVSNRAERYYAAAYLHYLIWYRTIFQPRAGRWSRIWASCSYSFYFSAQMLLALLAYLSGRSRYKPGTLIKAVKDAKSYAVSEEFLRIPLWPRN